MSVMNVGRPKGTTKQRLNMNPINFKEVLEFIKDNKKLNNISKGNAVKSFFLLYYFGFRVGELTMLQVKDITRMIEKRVISLANNTKGKTPREAPISLENVGVLEEVFADLLSDSPNCSIIRPWGRPMSQFTAGTLTRNLNSILKEALGEQYTTHSFRAGYVTSLHESGYDVETLRALMSHKNLETTTKYITVSEKTKRDAVKHIETVRP